MATFTIGLGRRFAAGIAVLALGLSAGAPAWAEGLDNQRANVAQQLTAAQQRLDSDAKSLANASSLLEQSRGQLAYAKSQLEETRLALAEAEAEDEAAAAKLAKAQEELEAAKAAVAQGERDVDTQRLELGNVARTQYQQRTGMVGIGMVVTGESTSDVSNRVQWSRTLLDTTQAELDKLEVVLAELVAAREQLAKIEEEIAAERARAAANLATRQELEAKAAQGEREVAVRVAAHAEAEAAASQTLTASQRYADELSAEQNDVERRIMARLQAQEAERLRQAQAERHAQEARGAISSRAAVNNTRGRVAADAATQHRQNQYQEPAATSASSFIKPVSGPVTSRYGMRLHPVLKVWKLHDGTDYGAACSAPIRAAAAGRVTESYYNGGYGHRLMIDHGRINGQAMTTGYNHATHYTARVGQQVGQGDIIGYVGNTGYSTGCHLHLMMWVNGQVVNPQTMGF